MLFTDRGPMFWRLFIVALFCGTIPMASAQSSGIEFVEDLQAQVGLIREDLQTVIELSELDASRQTWITLKNKITDLDAIAQSIAFEMDRLLEQERRNNRTVELLEQRLSILEQVLGDHSAADVPVSSGEVEDDEQGPDQVPTTTEGEQQTQSASTTAQMAAPSEPRAIVATEDQLDLLTDDRSSVVGGEADQQSPENRLQFVRNPGPPVPILRSDERGVIDRPIPRLRPMEDLDPQPLSDADFQSVLGELTLAMSDASASLSGEAVDNQVGVSAQPVDQVQQAYDAAYGLIAANRLQDAEDAFKTFLETHSEHPLASNAGYWLGETYFARNMYPLAMFAFASNVREYGDGRKAPDSLLKLAMTLGVLGQQTEACRLLAFLPIEYPSASEEILTRTGSEQQKLGCV